MLHGGSSSSSSSGAGAGAGAPVSVAAHAPPAALGTGGRVAAMAAAAAAAHEDAAAASPVLSASPAPSVAIPAAFDSASSVSGATFSRMLSLRRAAISAWRWPANPGEMPLYIQRSFRLKTFGLITAQLALIFAEMVLVHWLFKNQLNFDPASETGQMLFYALGALTLFVILWLHFLKDWYPANYLLLVATTLLVGLFWGLSPIAFGKYLHFQVIGILVIAMGVNTLLTAALTTEKVSAWHALLGAHAVGWLAGAATNVLVVTYFHLSTTPWIIVSLVVTFALLTGVLLLDAGRLLVKCNPDDFMSVVVAMDSALLVVSMPVFVLSCCLLHSAPADEAEQQAAGNGNGAMEGP